jgi:hypothetical protein
MANYRAFIDIDVMDLSTAEQTMDGLRSWADQFHLKNFFHGVDSGIQDLPVQKVVYLLHAKRPYEDNSNFHHFVEAFTDMTKVNEYLAKHPDVTKKEVTLHEVDPN